MLLLDDRKGSRELHDLLITAEKAPPVELTRLEFGDVAFMGEGPDGAWLSIGIEYKTINDVLDCIKNSRFADVQLRGMTQVYEVLYLLVEGRYCESRRTGDLLFFGRRGGKSQTSSVTFTGLLGWLTTVEQTGIHLRQTDNKAESASVVAALYNWWQKPYNKHKSLRGVYEAPASRAQLNPSGIQLFRHEPSFAEHALAWVRGIGYDTASLVVQRFPTIEALLSATERQLGEMPEIGAVLASRIYKALRGLS